MRVTLPIGNSRLQVGWFGLFALLPVYALWICVVLIWLTLLGTVAVLRIAFEWLLGVKSARSRRHGCQT